jgi:hypothetical protein
MKRLLSKSSIVLILILATQVFIVPPANSSGIGRDTSKSFNSGASAASQTISYTVGSTANAFLTVTFVSNQTGSDDVTSVTYNGVAMTQQQKVTTNGNARWSYYLFIASPDGSAHNLVINYSPNDSSKGVIASWNGAKQSGLDASTNRSNTTGPFNDAITTVADNSWTLLDLVSIDGNWTVGSGSNNVIGSGASSTAIFDSNGVIHPAGSNTMTSTNSTYSRDTLRSEMSIAPFLAAASSFDALLISGD